MDDPRDIVFVLGAGFSKPTGLPLMAEFWCKSQRELDHWRDPKRLNSRHITPLLVKAGETFGRFRDYCLQSECLNAQSDNLESIICIAEAMAEVGPKHVELGGRSLCMTRLNDLLKLWVWKMYHQCPLDPVVKAPQVRERGGTPGVCENAAKMMLSLGDRATFVTTNYDLIIEFIANQHDRLSHYPIKNGDAECFNISANDKHYATIGDETNTSAKYVPVCKLHGSANFFAINGDDNGKVYIATDIGDGTSNIGKSGRWEPQKGPTVLAVDSLHVIHKKYGDNTVPAIIPPTYAKLTTKRWLRSMWNAAYIAFTQAKVVIFVGYSFPPSDGFMRAMVQASLAARKSPPRVIVIDPSCETICRYQCLFRNVEAVCEGLDVALNSGRFEEIVSEL